MRILKSIALLLAMLTPGFAAASLEGAFWDPSQDGEGWTFESQNDTLAGTWYMYEQDGHPSFRVFVAQVTYTVGPAGQLFYTLNGDLYRTITRGNNTRVGAFSGSFGLVDLLPVIRSI